MSTSSDINETQIAHLHQYKDAKDRPVTEDQIRVIAALADTFVDRLSDEEAKLIVQNRLKGAGPSHQVYEFAKRRFSDYPGFIDEFIFRMCNAMSPGNFTNMKTFLTLLSTRAGTLIFCGRLTAFPDLPVKDREIILRQWQSSSLSKLRKAYIGFAMLSLNTLFKYSDLAGQAIGYPLTDPEINNKERFKEPSYPYRFIEVQDNMELEFDVVIVGSGAGGGVIAHTLSKAGYSVVVLEKAHYYSTEEFTLREGDAQQKFYESSGGLIGEEGSIILLAGNAFGGGTSINWSASLKPQHFVREEWANKYGLKYFLTDDFRQSLDYVSDRMGVSADHVKHNALNQTLINGSKKLGYHFDTIPQNTGGHAHECGFCVFGCKFNEKQSGLVTWLKDAAENGAQFIQDCDVKRIIIKKGKAIGVACDVKGKKLIVKGEKIICAGGGLHTPALLLRTKIPNPNIGMNLHLHPCAFVIGIFDEPKYPWKGSIMTAISNVVENRNGEYYGAKLEIVAGHPGLFGCILPWHGSKAHKEFALKYNHAVPILILTRDRDGGRVIIDENGKPRVNYEISTYDAQSILEGTIAGCEILFVEGAKEIVVTHPSVPIFNAKNSNRDLNDTEWKNWIGLVRRMGIVSGQGMFGSAHQMSSCRMGINRKTSVCDSDGKVWGVKNLYIGDGSTMPTASGANPMISIMGIAHSIAKKIIKNDNMNKL